MTEQELKQKMMALSAAAANAGIERVKKQVPYFTEMLFVWSHENGYDEALTEFLACFVDGAVIESMSMLSLDLLAIKNRVKRDAAKAHRKKNGEGGSDE